MCKVGIAWGTCLCRLLRDRLVPQSLHHVTPHHPNRIEKQSCFGLTTIIFHLQVLAARSSDETFHASCNCPPGAFSRSTNILRGHLPPLTMTPRSPGRFAHLPLSTSGPVECAVTGSVLLNTPYFNKGSAFPKEERVIFNLTGLLPQRVQTLEQQTKRAYQQYSTRQDDLAKNTFLTSLKEQNEVLYYRVSHCGPFRQRNKRVPSWLGDSCCKTTCPRCLVWSTLQRKERQSRTFPVYFEDPRAAF